jgi:hypothetical protein
LGSSPEYITFPPNYKIASMESGNYAIVQVAEALAKSGVKLVPDIVAGGGASGARSWMCC